MHNLAYETLLCAKADSNKIVKMLRTLSEEVGSDGMIGGEFVDVMSFGKTLTQEDIDFMFRAKTGALIAASIQLAALCDDIHHEKLNTLRKFGYAIGHAFQIQDDILLIEGNKEKIGKPINSDEKNNKPTYPAIVGLNAAKQKAKQLYQEAQHCLNELNMQESVLDQLAKYIIQRDY